MSTGPPAVMFLCYRVPPSSPLIGRRRHLLVSVSSRAHQPHESRLDTCRTCNEVAKGRLALPRPNGHDVLSVARLLFPPLGCVVYIFQ